MERVEQDGDWSLMCPAQCPGLSECWGKEFEELYTRYEKVRAEGNAQDGPGVLGRRKLGGLNKKTPA